MLRTVGYIFWGLLTLMVGVAGGYFAKDFSLQQAQAEEVEPIPTSAPPQVMEDTMAQVKPSPLLIGTYLGNESRNYYGDSLGESLSELWKVELGTGLSLVPGKTVPKSWSGAGWTGQPLLVQEGDSKFLLQGCYDHTLKKINAETGEIVWRYEFDDILKGTGTLWWDSETDSIRVFQGSRRGVYKSINAKDVFSFRSVCYHSGSEIWRYNVKKGPSYSRDVDASCLILDGKGYVGLENGTWMVFDPVNTESLQARDTNLTYNSPLVQQELPLYDEEDKRTHGSNIVTEASPCRLGDRLYVSSGAGHIYGYNLKTGELDWDLFLGADLDGTPAVTYDSCLLISVEKQFIKGYGGAMKVDPSKPADQSVVWFMPAENTPYAEWRGGVVGSVSTNDSYHSDGDSHLAAWIGIDGNLYVVEHDVVTGELAIGPDGKTKYPMPKKVDIRTVGPSISTPIFTKDKVVAAGYHGVHLFKYTGSEPLLHLDSKEGRYEATPIADRGRLFIASRNGYLYCLGDVGDAEKEDPLP